MDKIKILPEGKLAPLIDALIDDSYKTVKEIMGMDLSNPINQGLYYKESLQALR